MKSCLKRKFLTSIWLSAALAAMVGGCVDKRKTAAVDPKTPLSLRVGFVSAMGGVPSGPEGWLQLSGRLIPTLKRNGLNVDKVAFTPFPNGPDLNEALVSGSIDVGLVGDTPGILAKAAGHPTRLINQSAVGTNAWLVVRSDGPKTLEGLRGKTVATSKGSYMARYLLGLLEEKGLSKEVKFVHLLPPESEAALRHGDIAAYASPYGPLLQQHGFRVIDEARLHPGLSGSGVTVSTETFLAAHPTFPTAWNRTRAAGIADLHAHEGEYYAAEAKAQQLPVSLYKTLYPLRLYDPAPLTTQGLALLAGTKGFLLRQKLARNDFKISDWAIPNDRAGVKVAQAVKGEQRP